MNEVQRWACSWNGADIEVEVSTGAWTEEWTLRVDGRVVDQARGGLGPYLCAKVHLAGAEHVVEAHIAGAVDHVGLACKIFVDEVVVGGDVGMVFLIPEPTRYARWRGSFFVPKGEQRSQREHAEYTFRTRQKKLGDPTWVSPPKRFLALFFIALGILFCGIAALLSVIAWSAVERFGGEMLLLPLVVVGPGVGSLVLSWRLLHPKAPKPCPNEHLPALPPHEQPAAASLERMPLSASAGRRRRARS